ncbi:RNA polymerase sigma factor [Streptomyces sp. NPDC048172]|uniref:RNA polymerase sigma factor n=1 Tax=Streptomyces sp. NPDC048172 TaxID=3365505 RepID=UPI003710F904
MTELTLLHPHLAALLDAECEAEAAACPGTEADDLRQGVWLRWLRQVTEEGPPPDPAAWLSAAVRAETAAETPPAPPRVPLQRRVTAADGVADAASETEAPLLAAERRRALAAAVAGLPGRGPRVLCVMLARADLTYPEMARELGISQGSLGPLRSRCVARLRRMLTAEVAAPGLRGRVREATGVTRAEGPGATPSLSRARPHTTWGGMRTWA